MPEKDPHNWHLLWGSIPEPLRASALAWLVAMIRILYDGREPRWIRRFLESTLCGLIALVVAVLAQATKLDPGVATFLGGAVGLLGADWVREKARQLAEIRLSGGGK